MGFITMKNPALNKRAYVWVTFFQPPNHSKSKSTDFGMTFLSASKDECDDCIDKRPVIRSLEANGTLRPG